MTQGNESGRVEPTLLLDGVPYYSSAAITDELGVSRQTIWRWRKDGTIPGGHRFRDGRVLFTDDEFQEIRLFANRIEPATTEIYLDNCATTRPLPEVREAMLKVLGAGFGNPSSGHEAGVRARERLRIAREAVADLVGAAPEQLLFTSGATESNNMVLRSAVSGAREPRIVTTSIEHSSILATCEHLESKGVEIVYLPPNRDGRIDLDRVTAALTEDTSIVSVQWVNNETGVIQPVEAIGNACRKLGVPFHTDAAQAVGKLDVDLSTAPIDFLSISAHKIHGPAGVGAVYAANSSTLSPLIYGGSQEIGLRAGTENLPGIVGFGKAASLRAARWQEVQQRVEVLRDRFEGRLFEDVPEARLNGTTRHRIKNTTNLRFGDLDGQALVARLDQAGIRCSQNSACTNMRPEPSYVLTEMGLSESQAYASVRFSFSEENTLEEVDAAVREITEVCNSLRAFRERREARVRETAGIES